jgi:hypothetical protein
MCCAHENAPAAGLSKPRRDIGLQGYIAGDAGEGKFEVNAATYTIVRTPVAALTRRSAKKKRKFSMSINKISIIVSPSGVVS